MPDRYANLFLHNHFQIVETGLQVVANHFLHVHHQQHHIHWVGHSAVKTPFYLCLVAYCFCAQVASLVRLEWADKMQVVVYALALGYFGNGLLAGTYIVLLAIPCRYETNRAIFAFEGLHHIGVHFGPFAELVLVLQQLDVGKYLLFGFGNHYLALYGIGFLYKQRSYQRQCYQNDDYK